MNRLYYGDNLTVLRDSIGDESVDLIYLDPPFNSQANYNVLFKSTSGEQPKAQIEAFEDTWHWNDHAEGAFDEVMKSGNGDVAEMLRALRSFLKENDMMAYITMMAVRLLELHRVLNPAGSLYLHCDPTASHYLKILLDGVFGADGFRNDITWKRAETVKGNFGQGSKFFDRNTDSILFYAKSPVQRFIPQFTPYTQEYIDGFYKYTEEGTGRIYRLISMTGPGGAAKGNPEYEVIKIAFERRSRHNQVMDGITDVIDEGGLLLQRQNIFGSKGFHLLLRNVINCVVKRILPLSMRELVSERDNVAEVLLNGVSKSISSGQSSRRESRWPEFRYGNGIMQAKRSVYNLDPSFKRLVFKKCFAICFRKCIRLIKKLEKSAFSPGTHEECVCRT